MCGKSFFTTWIIMLKISRKNWYSLFSQVFWGSLSTGDHVYTSSTISIKFTPEERVFLTTIQYSFEVDESVNWLKSYARPNNLLGRWSWSVNEPFRVGECPLSASIFPHDQEWRIPCAHANDGASSREIHAREICRTESRRDLARTLSHLVETILVGKCRSNGEYTRRVEYGEL